MPVMMNAKGGHTELIAGVDRVGEETGREADMGQNALSAPQPEQPAIGSGVEALGKIDMNNEEFRKKQKDLMSIVTADQTTAGELEQAMTTLHIARRSRPQIPGQNTRHLIWNQVIASARIAKSAMARLSTGSGLQGTIICDDAGLSKTNSALAGLLAVRVLSPDLRKALVIPLLFHC